MKTNSARRGLLAASIGGVAVMSIAGALWFSSESAPDTVAHRAVDAVPAPRLNLRLSRWVNEVNDRSAAYEVAPLSIVDEKSTCEVWCTTLYSHGPFVRYLVSHRDDLMNELTIFAGGDGVPNSGVQIALSLLILVRALADDPSEQSIPDATAKFIRDLTSSGRADATISGVRYTAQRMPDVGIVISASKQLLGESENSR